MPQCQYYNVARRPLPSREPGPNRMPPPLRMSYKPWCAHPKHSPVPKPDVANNTLFPKKLECQGDLNKCPLIQDQFLDT